jgi:dynein light intermediate chain 2
MEFKQSLADQFANNEDRASIDPMPLQTMIIGTKYDLFEKYDTESRKWLARALRFIAHHNNCSFYVSSSKSMQVGAQLRGYFQ